MVKVPYKETYLVGDVMPSGSTPSWIVLHGAGTADRERYRKLRLALGERNIPNAAFDFVGHGDTGGELLGSSLEDRTNQAAHFIHECCTQDDLVVVGASMSAYTAVKLSEIFAVEKLVLIASTAYTPRAYKLAFGPEFKKVISEKDSYLESDIFSILSNFKGVVRIVIAENDDVIPQQITEKLINSARDSKSFIVKNSPHKIAAFLNENPSAMQDVINFITS